MLRHIDGSVKSWQWLDLRHRLVFALLGVVIALSYALLLDGKEAQAKGGKQSPNGGSAERAIGGSAKPAREAVGEVNKPASNGGGGDKNVESLAAKDPAPRADRPEPVDNGTVRDAAKPATLEQGADKAHSAVDWLPETNPPIANRAVYLGEVAETSREATKPAVEPGLDEKATPIAGSGPEWEAELPRAEPALEEATTRLPKAESILEEAAEPEIAPVLNRATSEAMPTLERVPSPVGPVLEETASTVGPLLDTASSKIQPALEGAPAPISPVLQRPASPVEPLLGEINSPVEPALAETLPAVEPVLNGAAPAPDMPVSEAIGSLARPLGEEAIPVSGSVLEDATLLGGGPAIGATTPVFNSVSETLAPVVSSSFGEGVVRQNAGLPVLADNAGAIPASLSALQSYAPAAQTQGALGSARESGSVRGEPPASSVEQSGARSLFDGSFAINGSHMPLPGAVTAENAREGPPRPFPFELPPAVPLLGISFGSSGAGVALDLLALLVLLPILSRAGGSSWSTRAAFKLGSSLQLAVERPG